MLRFLLDHPGPIVWLTDPIFILRVTPAGIGLLTRLVVAAAIGAVLRFALSDRAWGHKLAGSMATGGLLVVAVLAQ